VSEGAASAGPLRVVVVDDDPLVLAVTKRVLARLGYEVAVFDDAQRALQDLAESKPFAVIADLHMPDVDGVELLGMAAQRSPATFRLLYTGEGQPSELARALVPGLTHAVVAKSEGVRLLPEALERLRSAPR
jgi:CheY-like chemotaxis protein